MPSPSSRLDPRFAAVLFVVFAASCATAPTAPPVPGAAAAWLGGTPRVVVRLDATQVSAWSQVTKSKAALKPVGERTKTVWLGFDLANLDDIQGAADTVRVVLEGDFPRAGVGLMLDWNASWKKSASGVWTNAPLRLSVSLPRDGLLAVRRGDPQPATPAEGVLRDLDARELERSAAWVTFWSPGEALFGETGARLLPVARADLVLQAAEGALEGPVLLRFPDERSAKAATVLLKLFAPQIRSRLGQDLAWTVDGTTVTGATLRLDAAFLEGLARKLIAGDIPAEAP